MFTGHVDSIALPYADYFEAEKTFRLMSSLDSNIILTEDEEGRKK